MTQDQTETRARLITQAQTLMQTVESEARSLSAEESQTLDRILADVDKIDAEARHAERVNKVSGLVKSLDEPVGRIATAARAAHKHNSDEYREAFFHYLRSNDSSELRALSIATNTAGGFTVPQTTEARIVEKMYQASVIRNLASVRTTPDDRLIAVENGLGTAAVVNEAATIAANDVSFTQVSIGAHKYATRITVSRELMDDSAIDLEAYIVDKLSMRIARAQEEHFWDGNDNAPPNGQPQGVITGATVGKTATAGQVSTGLTKPEDIFDWIHSLAPQYRSGAVILTSDEVVSDIRKMREGSGTGAFMWEPNGPSSAMRDGAAGTIAGVPYYICEFVNTIAANAVVGVYGQFSNYEIFDRGATEILVDPYSNAANWQVNLYVVKRTDAVRTLDEAFRTFKMAST